MVCTFTTIAQQFIHHHQCHHPHSHLSVASALYYRYMLKYMLTYMLNNVYVCVCCGKLVLLVPIPNDPFDRVVISFQFNRVKGCQYIITLLFLARETLELSKLCACLLPLSVSLVYLQSSVLLKQHKDHFFRQRQERAALCHWISTPNPYPLLKQLSVTDKAFFCGWERPLGLFMLDLKSTVCAPQSCSV